VGYAVQTPLYDFLVSLLKNTENFTSRTGYVVVQNVSCK